MAMNGLGWTFDTVADTYEKYKQLIKNKCFSEEL